MRKVIIVLFIAIFLSSLIAPGAYVSASLQAPELLFEAGLNFYKQGRYEDALHEFKETLLLYPGYEPALQYIRIIEGKHKLIKKKDTTSGALSAVPNFLFETGKKYYRQGRYEQALDEFQKALSIKPDYAPALQYVELLKKKGFEIKEIPAISPVKPETEGVVTKSKKYPSEKKIKYAPFKPASATSSGAIRETLELFELQQEMIARTMPSGLTEEGVGAEKAATPAIVKLDEDFNKITQPVEIAQTKTIVVQGDNIQRFLIVEPNVLAVEQKGPDELNVTGKDLGYTYLHVWDNHGRWTIEFLTTLEQPEAPTLEESMRLEEEKASTFKLSYALSYSSARSGRGVSQLKETSYTWGHRLVLTGETPYGNLDSIASITSLKTTTDLTYFTLGLKDGKFGSLKDFALRVFDYGIPFSNLSIPGSTLRGGLLTSPVFNKKLDYAVFWGREGGGRYGNLSPGLVKIKNSFLNGFGLNYSPTSKQNYRFSLTRGWGRDRTPGLPRYGYDTSGSWALEFDKAHSRPVVLGYEIAFDSKKFAYLFRTSYAQPKLSLSSELRNINKSFSSMTGGGWRQGEFGGLFNLNFQPTDKLSISSMLDIFRDRLFPAEFNTDRWNENFDLASTYNIDSLTTLNLDFNLQNLRGKLAPSRSESESMGLTHRFKIPKDIFTFINYIHQKSENFSSPASSYVNNKITSGLRFALIGDLFYYLNGEMDWVQELATKNLSRPYAYETGLDWANQIGTTPFYGNLRFSYRNELNTGTNSLSFLSGQDYIDGYAGLSYRPASDKEIYASAHIRNNWANNSSIAKRVDGDFNAGIRYLWDTGLSWEAVGNIDGYVFKDWNSDGLRQRDEAPVEGIKLWLGKDRYTVTDLFGYYRFDNVKGRKAYVSLDASTLPQGFVLTVPLMQEVAITHHGTAKADFGIISRNEITGLVFEDVNGDGEYNPGDKGVQGAVLTLDDGSQATTDESGRYAFPDASTGEHTITLDLASLPVYYLPQSALTKTFTLFEGVSYLYNIPLKRVKE